MRCSRGPAPGWSPIPAGPAGPAIPVGLVGPVPVGRSADPDAAAIGELARRHGIALHELTPQVSSLEDVYTRLTDASVEHRSGALAGSAGERVR